MSVDYTDEDHWQRLLLGALVRIKVPGDVVVVDKRGPRPVGITVDDPLIVIGVKKYDYISILIVTIVNNKNDVIRVYGIDFFLSQYTVASYA